MLHATPCDTTGRPARRSDDFAGLAPRLRRDGFAVVPGTVMRSLADAAGARDWPAFAASWDDLGVDRFMADGGTYRKRRFACLGVSGAAIGVKPPQAHFQTRENNPLNGGVARTFAPVLDGIALHPANRALVGICRDLFEAVLPAGPPAAGWHAEMHQFRIEARPDAAGRPTPEGLHRDGIDGVLVLMVRRENVEGGESTIADAGGRALARTLLAEPFDALLVDDGRVLHGVSPVTARDPARPAFRDVLVLTFRAEAH